MSELPPSRKVSWFYRFVKRGFDVFNSLLLLIVLLPLLLILALLVVCTSRGGAIYLDPRIGKNGKPFKLFKFRSMVHDAELHPEKYLTPEQMEQWRTERKVDNDPRLTKFGRFMRKTSLDELPQFLNIFLGTMSFVGPRPITDFELKKHFSDAEAQRMLMCRPGLLGVWAVNGRSKVTFESGERQKLELSYLEKRSLGFDLKLIFKVIPAVITRKGAE